MKKSIAIQMDHIEKIDYEFDTSFLIGYEAQERGYDIFYYNPKDLFIKENTIQASGYYLELFLDEKNYFNFKSNKIIAKLEDFQFIFLRQDPPFDMNYITSTYILDLLPSSTIVVNNPTAVRNSTEKLFTFNFKEFMPPTLVTKDLKIIEEFLDKEEDIITKPLYGNGGEGIHRFDKTNFNSKILEEYLHLPIMVQKFINEIEHGDRRIILNHITPNCMAPLIVVGTLQTAHAISLEATLSFLGLGLPITEPSLGLLIGNGFEFMYSGDYWISIFPGIALLVTIVSINLVGDQLRDIFNPRLQR